MAIDIGVVGIDGDAGFALAQPRAPAGYLAKFVFVSTLDAGNQF
jgi:hypothetical protein